MSSCTFFGHYNSSEALKPILVESIRKLIECYSVDKFYIGDKGNFDSMARRCVIELAEEYPYIEYEIVLAYMPGKKDEFKPPLENTVYPEGLEKVPRKYAIIRRNQIMAKESDFAIVYIYKFGGAATATEYADKRGVKIINITDDYNKACFVYKNEIFI